MELSKMIRKVKKGFNVKYLPILCIFCNKEVDILNKRNCGHYTNYETWNFDYYHKKCKNNNYNKRKENFNFGDIGDLE